MNGKIFEILGKAVVIFIGAAGAWMAKNVKGKKR